MVVTRIVWSCRRLVRSRNTYYKMQRTIFPKIWLPHLSSIGLFSSPRKYALRGSKDSQDCRKAWIPKGGKSVSLGLFMQIYMTRRQLVNVKDLDINQRTAFFGERTWALLNQEIHFTAFAQTVTRVMAATRPHKKEFSSFTTSLYLLSRRPALPGTSFFPDIAGIICIHFRQLIFGIFSPIFISFLGM